MFANKKHVLPTFEWNAFFPLNSEIIIPYARSSSKYPSIEVAAESVKLQNFESNIKILYSMTKNDDNYPDNKSYRWILTRRESYKHDSHIIIQESDKSFKYFEECFMDSEKYNPKCGPEQNIPKLFFEYNSNK